LLTREALKLLASAMGFAITGMVMGNQLLLHLGLAFLAFTLLALNISQPQLSGYQPPPESMVVYVDDDVELNHRLEFQGGPGLVTLGQSLPSHFQLVEGENVSAHWVGGRGGAVTHRFVFKCTRRGVYVLRGLNWESRHPFRLRPTEKGRLPVSTEIIVKPRALSAKRIRNQRVFTKIPMPAESQTRLGVPTTDFQELREYRPGDSYRHVNWKATARRMRPDRRPTVNEYEREGRRVVFILLDVSPRLALGNSLRNCFEYGVQAALVLSEFYLSRQCMVGLVLFNSTGGQSLLKQAPPVQLFPEAGKMQLTKIQRLLLGLEMRATSTTLAEAAGRLRGYLWGSKPLFILVTNLGEENQASIKEGIRELRKYIRGPAPGNPVLINVSGYNLAVRRRGERTAAGLLRLYENARLQSLAGMGVNTLNWDPSQSSVVEVLLRELRRR